MYFSTGSQLSSALASLSASKVGQFLAFDALYYSNTYMLNGNTTALTAIEHFVQIGAPAMAKPNATFDPVYYKQHYADLTGTNLDAADLLYHFMQFGLDEGRLPNGALAATFNSTTYLAAYPDVAAYVNANLDSFGGSASNGALAHYVKFGMAQGFVLPTAATAGTSFTLNATTVLGSDGVTALDIMKLVGDSDVRIDLTGNTNQIKGLDLNGNGVIQSNGTENVNPTTQDDGKDFEIVDAYARNRSNESDITQNFLGDISYDGTGFEGDGVSTDGNIVLGGLGADTILGGIGNDFLAGGGVASSNGGADRLDGGRNADFFFAELSLLDNTDGNNLTINGGSTSDDAAVGNNTPQDADWLLLEVSDDEDGTVVNLADGADADFTDENDQSITTGAGRTTNMTEIEHVDASGNLYGFLNKVAVSLGGAGSVVTNDEGTLQNVAIGSSAQLHIIGSLANNILIGGFDNDLIEGGIGSDLLFGGNLNYNNNTNLANIVNNGMDELIGGADADNIVFEADGGIVEGGTDIGVDDAASDTLWLTRESWGDSTAAAMTTDSTLRLDLAAGKEGGIDNAAGYGGANAGGNGTTPGSTYTADQTNYAVGSNRVQVQDMESVIATGLGGVDYMAAGTNAPDLSFNNQQNHRAFLGNLDLRGTEGASNTLYAAAGDDVLEGRTGDDMLSGGEGNDDFLFDLENGDDLDVIWRQADANNNNLWDVDADGNVVYSQDFGVESTSAFGPSELSVDFTGANLADANVWMGSFALTIGTVNFAVADLVALKAVTTVAGLATLANTAFQAIDSNVTVTAVGNVLTVTDSTPTGGRNISDTAAEGYAVVTSVTAPGTSTLGLPVYTPAGESVSQDRLIFVAYDNRLDNERVDDDAMFGGDSLGGDAYAQDLVVGFDVDGSTVLAEDQSFRIDLENLAVQDIVNVIVNEVLFSLQVGKELDGTLIPNETTEAFANRLSDYINDYLDDDTAAGKVTSTFDASPGSPDTGAFVLTQATYAGEETVFMQVSVVVDDNSSNGEGAYYAVTNQSDTDITLFEFDGRNNAFKSDNVLFVGDTNTNRAVLATALTAGGTLNGSDAIVVNVTADDNVASSALEGIGGAAIFFNAVENPTTGNLDNFAIHGDDQLFGGAGTDTIVAGTGDDRVYGSLGADRISGGKDLYLVDGVVRVLNDAEAIVVDALPATLKIEILEDGRFDDTLIYQQSDFGVVGATGATFNIALDLSALQSNGGAGRVIVNGAVANTALFTNMENIRTVSGNGTLVGQGNDTLDLSVSVDPITGVATTNANNMRYFLTKEANQGGEVLMLVTPASKDATGAGTLFTKVDGVENVIGGTGTDYLTIDQTESGKNNSFNAGTSTAGDNAAETAANGDKITYVNNGVALTAEQLPAVKLSIGAANVDTVTMTDGMLPANDAPVDTLTGVEFIVIDAVAQNVDEADELDVSALTAGATVDFGNGEISNGATLVATVTGTQQFELVTGSTGDDTVILADTMTNASADAADGAENAIGNILFDSFLTYDVIDETVGATVDADALLERMDVAALRSVTGANLVAAQAEIDDAINQSEYTFALGAGTSDRVDYSAETGAIAAVIDIGATSTNVLVDQAGDFASMRDLGDRIDVLEGVEEIVAALGDSILDFTASDSDVQITFQYQVANTDVLVADDQIESIVRIADGSGNVIAGLSAFVERYTVGDANVTWNRIEGSDNNESVRYEGSENLVTQVGVDHRYSNDELNLRGGDNGVSYTAIETSITVDITVDEDTGAGDGMITAEIDFQDGNSGALAGAGTHTVTSYTADNSITGGTLKIEASQDAEDTVSFNTESDKVFLLGVSAGVLNVSIGADNTMVLTGFEILQDADSDDVYDMADLETVQEGMDLQDNLTDDRDTIKVLDDAVDYDGGPNALDTNGGGANTGTISLETLNDVFGFDFDVLDITGVEETDLIIVGDDDDQDGDATLNAADTDYVGPGDRDEDGANDVARDLVDDLIVGDLDLIDSVNAFTNIWFTNASIEGVDTFELDTTLAELNHGTDSFSTDTLGLNFSLVTTAVDVSVVGNGNTTLVGTAAADTITGGGGDDEITGGGGNDTLDGGSSAEVQSIDITGALDAVAAAGNRVSFDWLGAGNLTLTEAAAADVDYTDGAGAVVDGAGTSVVGAALAALLNSNLTQVNADWQTTYAAPTEVITGVTFAVGVMTFTFASGVNVANLAALGENYGVTPDAGTFNVSATSEVAAGSDGGSDTFFFADSAANNGVDTITGFIAGLDFLDFTNLEGDSNSHGVAANAADQSMHGDGEVYVFADGADGTGAETITNYSNTTDVAAFLAAAFNDESAFSLVGGTGWISAVINDLLTDTAYVYDVRVGSDNILDAGSVVLMGVVSVDAALTTADMIN